MTRRMAVPVATLVLTAWAAPMTGQMIMGFKGGANLATASISADGAGLDAGSRTSWHAAVLLGFGLKPGFSVEVPMMYVGKGFERDSGGSGVQANLKLSYFEVPLLAVVTFPSSPSKLAARVFAGPAFGLRAGCNLTPVDQDPGGFTDCDADISKSLDFSILAGAGIKIGAGVGGLTIDVSYDYGLSDFVKQETGTSGKNRNLMVSVGYLIPII